MNMTIFGATGKTGIPLVRQALDAGHRVKAFVRTPAKMTITHENLQLVQGDVLDEAAVGRAIGGADAVLCVLGHVRGSPADLQTRAMQHITAAMRTHGVKRLVDLTGAGVRDPQDHPKLSDRLVTMALRTIAPQILEDGNRHVEVIRASQTDWTVVRAPILTNGPRKGTYRVGFVGKDSGPRISRADVADFMLNEAQECRYVGMMPMISY